MSDQALHIAIDVSLTDDQIQGQVGDGVGRSTHFSGWLGLIGQLDDILGTAERSTADSGDPAPGERER
jgi:hypothetical protein